MPLQIQSEKGEERRRRAGRLPKLLLAVPILGFVVILSVVFFSPVPLELGNVILVGPSSSSQLVMIHGTGPAFTPPGRYEFAYRFRNGKVGRSFWVDRLYVRFPFALLIK